MKHLLLSLSFIRTCDFVLLKYHIESSSYMGLYKNNNNEFPALTSDAEIFQHQFYYQHNFLLIF
jgi:hypothetical protein